MTLFSEILSRTELDPLQDPVVKTAVERLVPAEQLSDLNLAGACLGNSEEAVEALASMGVLPAVLTPAEREELRTTLGVDRLGSSEILQNKRETAAWLGLPPAGTPRPRKAATRVAATYPLFPHQRKALTRARGIIDRHGQRLLIHMPTGSGKTRTAMNLVADQLRGREPTGVLWVAATKELCEQALDEFTRAWQHLGNREVQILAGWGGADWEPSSFTDGLLVVTPQTLHQRKVRLGARHISDLAAGLSLIVFDEAHQAIASTYRDVVEHLASAGIGLSQTPVVGLSATPGRTFLGSDLDAELAAFFDNNKVTLDTFVAGKDVNPVEYLITEGYLARPEFRLLEPGNTASSEQGSEQSQFSDAVEDYVDSTLSPEDYLVLVGQAVKELILEEHRRIIVFAASVDLANALAALLRSLGILAEAVHGGTPSHIRQGMIERYRSGSSAPRVLVNYGVITTGFDAPRTSAAVIARPTHSLVLYSQMVGRAIRGPKAGGNRTATVITIVDPGVAAFGSIAAAFTHWEDMWNE